MVVVNKFQMSREENIFYAKRNLVDSIYKEANIEGISATFPETKEIFEGRTVSRLSVDETIAINNLKHAWQFILNNLDADIDLSFLSQVNKEINQGLTYNPGELRDVVVSIGGTAWKPELPDFDIARDKYKKLGSELNSLDMCLELFVNICRDQLFIDGNKRTAQLVVNAAMIRNGYGVLAIPVEYKQNWEERLIFYYETNDADQLKQFLVNNCVDGYTRI